MIKLIKTIIFIQITFLNVAVAQYPFSNSYKLGVSTTFFGSGDMRGLNMMGEYNRKINNHLTFSPSLHVGYGRVDITRYVSAKKESGAVNLNLFVSPMRFEKSKFRIGIGPSLRYTTGGLGIYVGRSGDIRQRRRLSVGYSLIAESEFNVFNSFILGFGAGIQSYFNGERVSYLGLNGGYKF